MRPNSFLECYSGAEIEKIRRSGEILAKSFLAVEREIIPGMTTGKLDEIVGKIIRSYGGRAAFNGYKVGRLKYRHNACLSVNQEVVHGVPGTRRLVEGDLLKMDMGVEKDGYFSDATRTFTVGAVAPEAERLSAVTRRALLEAISACRPGNRIGDIGAAIQQTAEQNGYSVVRSLTGHGVGRNLHEDPQVPCYGKPGTGLPLMAGMVLAIEPMVNQGVGDVRTSADGWTVVTADGRLSAHWEETVAVTESGPVILTEWTM